MLQVSRFSLYRHLFVEERPETSSARINLMVDYLAFTLYFPREWRTMQLITFGIDLTNPSVACGIIFGAIQSRFGFKPAVNCITIWTDLMLTKQNFA